MQEQNNEPKQEEAKQEQPKLSEEELQQIQQAKNMLHMQIQSAHAALVKAIKGMPINPIYVNRALLHVDDGILWAHEGLRIADIRVQRVDMKEQQKPVNEPAKENEPLPLAAGEPGLCIGEAMNAGNPGADDFAQCQAGNCT